MTTRSRWRRSLGRRTPTTVGQDGPADIARPLRFRRPEMFGTAYQESITKRVQSDLEGDAYRQACARRDRRIEAIASKSTGAMTKLGARARVRWA